MSPERLRRGAVATGWRHTLFLQYANIVLRVTHRTGRGRPGSLFNTSDPGYLSAFSAFSAVKCVLISVADAP